MTTPARPSSSAVPPSVPLTYTIASSTPHSGKYVPENIMVDKPQDQSSRWSGAFQGNTTDQWIILRLESLSVLGEFRRVIPEPH
jgi:muskelin